MGSVITYDDKCPKCKKEKGVSDFYYKSREEYFTCLNDNCLFYYSYEWKRNKDHNLETKDGTANYRFENLIMVETVIENGIEKKKENGISIN